MLTFTTRAPPLECKRSIRAVRERVIEDCKHFRMKSGNDYGKAFGDKVIQNKALIRKNG